MFLAREHTDQSLEDVGRFFGNRDHTTVLYAVSKVKKRVAQDRAFQAQLEELASRLPGRQQRRSLISSSVQAGA